MDLGRGQYLYFYVLINLSTLNCAQANSWFHSFWNGTGYGRIELIQSERVYFCITYAEFVLSKPLTQRIRCENIFAPHVVLCQCPPRNMVFKGLSERWKDGPFTCNALFYSHNLIKKSFFSRHTNILFQWNMVCLKHNCSSVEQKSSISVELLL